MESGVILICSKKSMTESRDEREGDVVRTTGGVCDEMRPGIRQIRGKGVFSEFSL
jgi:hypothetical protein